MGVREDIEKKFGPVVADVVKNEIAAAIKAVLAEYDAGRESAEAKYGAAVNPARAEFEAVRAAALAKNKATVKLAANRPLGPI